jgi:hypothetical protein
MNIDEAALKADPSDSEIMEIAGRWFHTGENQHRADGYYYRSLGTPTNVRGSDLIAFARALLHRSQPVAVVPAEQAEDSLASHFSPFYLLSNARGLLSDDWHGKANWAIAARLFAVGSTTAKRICREAGIDPDANDMRKTDAAMSNREAGGS